jgi:transcriptional regulator with XRE-family HTH domain
MSNEVANYLEAAATMEVFVDAIRARMIVEGVTQDELARRLGVHKTAVSRTLNKKGGNCSFQTADEFAAALGTTTIELLTSAVR